MDKFREECGLIGIWNEKEAANLAYLGLYSQQHRGQEGAGVISMDESDHSFHLHRGLGLVEDVFSRYDFSRLPGRNAIGHVRYSTAGSNTLSNVQPFYAHVSSGKIALAHNGNLVNAEDLRKRLIDNGSILSSTSDTEIILHLIASNSNNCSLLNAVTAALRKVRGAYSLLMLSKDAMFALRDPNGFRPLAVGSLGDGYVAASETCAFDLLGAEYIRDIAPGEIVEIGKDGLKSYFPFEKVKESPCIFEYIYFARPDSQIFGRNVYRVRKRLGRELSREAPVKADYVIAVPDSGMPAAFGYSEESGIPLELGLIRNHYVGRTFIEPKQSIRDFGVKIKHNANSGILKGKKIIVVDDSIVRGTTTRKLIKMLRAAGAKEVHIRISAPPTIDPCYYGIDTPRKEKLIASSMSVEEIRRFVGADSLVYLSRERMFKAVGAEAGSLCDACFTGNYPVVISDRR